MEIADETTDDGDVEAPAFGDEDGHSGSHSEPKLENYAIEELEKTLARHIEREEYEEAARVAEILKRKRAKDTDQA